LTDPFEGISKCISHALVTLGRKRPLREDLGWCIGPPLKNSLAELLDTVDDRLAEKALAIYRERFGAVGIYENEIYEDIPDVLSELKAQGHQLFVATSKPTVYAERIIENFQLQRFFSHIYGSELDGTRNDKSSLISYILNSESITPPETIMIGDRKHDIIGAKANGVDGVGVLWGYGTREELEVSGASVCIERPQDLISNMKFKSNNRLLRTC
jgi:phosphoglycolate phosphatase